MCFKLEHNVQNNNTVIQYQGMENKHCACVDMCVRQIIEKDKGFLFLTTQAN